MRGRTCTASSLVISQAAEVLINATNQSMDSWDLEPVGNHYRDEAGSNGCAPGSALRRATPASSPAAAPRAT
ncbi:hypothetical protein MJ390_15860 [Klebsiella pneumoniae]|nr:hypothetical protein MJ390_15860 [Klebsiella pneumoniae]